MPVASFPSRPLKKPAASQPLLQRVFDSADAIMLAIGSDGSILEMNATACRKLGISSYEAGFCFLSELLRPGEMARMVDAVQSAAGQCAFPSLRSDFAALTYAISTLPPGEAAIVEAEFQREDGTSLPVTLHLSPLNDARGRTQGVVAVGFERMAAPIRTNESALDSLKDEFIATVSHELRTPLTSIRGALGLLSSGLLGEVNEKAAHLLRIAVTNSDRLVHLINDILDLERIQSGLAPVTFRPVQLAQIVGQAIDGMLPVAETAGVKLTHDTQPVVILGDADRLLQVLANLLSNAIKFSPPQSTVAVHTGKGIAGVTVSVVDEGRGIPEEKLESIFGRFQQVEASDASKKGGTGLGLAICRNIVTQHSGRIWAERNAEQGATLRVFLPYRPDPDPHASADPDTVPAANGSSTNSASMAR